MLSMRKLHLYHCKGIDRAYWQMLLLKFLTLAQISIRLAFKLEEIVFQSRFHKSLPAIKHRFKPSIEAPIKILSTTWCQIRTFCIFSTLISENSTKWSSMQDYRCEPPLPRLWTAEFMSLEGCYPIRCRISTPKRTAYRSMKTYKSLKKCECLSLDSTVPWLLSMTKLWSLSEARLAKSMGPSVLTHTIQSKTAGWHSSLFLSSVLTRRHWLWKTDTCTWCLATTHRCRPTARYQSDI